MALMGLSYVGGAMIYKFKIPERFYPGKFDIWFSSHAIWHVFVLLGALAQTNLVIYGFLSRHTPPDWLAVLPL
jgi:adiponectin receptor